MNKVILYGLILVVIMTVVLIIKFYVMVEQSKNIANVGLVNGALQVCPNRPSCVCSMDNSSKQHVVAALNVPSGVENVIATLAIVIKAMPNTDIISQEHGYLHATFISRLFRFVDDVELLLDGDKVQIRSVSRVGYSDFGVNRKRVEAIRAAFE